MHTIFISFCILAGCGVLALVVLGIYALYQRIEGHEYTERDLIDFGNYLFSDERNNNYNNQHARSAVADWDLDHFNSLR